MSALILVAGIACVLIQRYWYIAKMHRLGAAVIGEAYRVRDNWPDNYPAYRIDAAAAHLRATDVAIWSNTYPTRRSHEQRSAEPS